MDHRSAVIISEYTTVQLCAAAGITYRQASHWASTGVLVPSVVHGIGSGSRSIYNDDDLYVARVLAVATKYMGTLQGDTMRRVSQSARRLLERSDRPSTVYLVFLSPDHLIACEEPRPDFPYFVIDVERH